MYQVDRFAVTLPLPERADELLAFHGRWVREFQPHRLNLKHGGYHQENRRGRTSHEIFLLYSRHTGLKAARRSVGFPFWLGGNHRLRSDVKQRWPPFYASRSALFCR